MAQSPLFQPVNFGKLTLKNRFCIPPIVIFGYGEKDGTVTEKNVAHYSALARGGAGLIIQEATCVAPGGRITPYQLGLWDDRQMEGCKRIVDAVHRENVPIFVQIHHSGIMSPGEEEHLCAGNFSFTWNGELKRGREMTLEEIRTIRDAFIAACRRAYLCGYDGVELHGCHKYLLCQFMNKKINTRADEYGQDEMKLVLEILEGVRAATSPDFVIGIRLGGFEPTLEDAIGHAKRLEAAGIDFIDVSYGFDVVSSQWKPEDFPGLDIHFAAGEIKKNVSVPVMAVFGIQTLQQAETLANATGADLVDVARAALVNYNWVNDVAAGKDPGKCLGCPNPKCAWRHAWDCDPLVDCAGRKLLARKK